ncbi:rhodanese-like domain-containing protein [Namhaeicola litoreus]|uniref:Rhodanese-like domain-containing protein n=1 Tax=Namhaeicola litoreus TaxID=1052145 RepID=A0ABW3Y0X3_9FLAO
MKLLKVIPFFTFVFFVLISCGQNSESSNGKIQKVNVDDFRLATENEVIIDVRTPGEYESGHIQNAININVNDSDFKARIEKLNKNEKVYVYCKIGSRSNKAAKILAESGFSQVYDLNGGIISWQRANLPLEK